MLYIVKVCYMKRERISQVFSLYAYGYDAESREAFCAFRTKYISLQVYLM